MERRCGNPLERRCAVKYEGDNGQLEIREGQLVITRQGMRARAAFGKDVPERQVPLEALSGITLKEATRLKSGWLQLMFGGQDEAPLSMGTAASNANTITFAHKKQESFRELHDRLLGIVKENSEAGTDPGQVEWDQMSGQLGRFEKGASPEKIEKTSKLEKLVGQAEEHLEANEEVVAAVQGSYEVKRMGADSIRKGALIATDRRILFYAKKMGGYDLESFPYDHVSSIEMSKGMTGHSITLYASGNKVHIKYIDSKQDVPGFVGTVRGRMKGGAGSGAGAPGTSKPDVQDQSRRLGQLRDEGLLTEEEFNAKKAQLLGL
jgi:hypothetical protein